MFGDRFILVVGIVLIVFAILSLAASLGNFGLTGLQVSKHSNLSFEVTQSLAVSFTVDSIDWGSGRVDTNETSSKINSEGEVTNSNESSWNKVDKPLILRNVGNLNAEVKLSAGSDASEFIGGGNASDAPAPEYKWKVSNNEPDSCVNSEPKQYTDVNTSSPGTKVCDPLKYYQKSDEMALDIEVLVPYDATNGSRKDTITATAIAD